MRGLFSMNIKVFIEGLREQTRKGNPAAADKGLLPCIA